MLLSAGYSLAHLLFYCRPLTMIKKIITYAAYLIFALMLIFAVTYVIFPVDFIEDRARAVVFEKTGAEVSMRDFRKAFPFGFKAKDIRLVKNGQEFLYFEEGRLSFRPSGLFSGSLAFRVTGKADSGLFIADVDIGSGKTGISARVIDAGLGSFYGAKKGGAINGGMDFTFPEKGCAFGRVELKGRDPQQDIVIKGLTVPFGRIKTFGLSVDVKDCMAKVKNLWIEGEDASARVNGDIALVDDPGQGRLWLKIELMPGKSAAQEPLFRILSAYKKTAGYYLLAISGTIAAPALD